MPAQTHTCTYTHTASLCVKQQECISEPHMKSAAGHFFSLAEIMQLPLQHLDVSGRSCQLMWNCETFLKNMSVVAAAAVILDACHIVTSYSDCRVLKVYNTLLLQELLSHVETHTTKPAVHRFGADVNATGGLELCSHSWLSCHGFCITYSWLWSKMEDISPADLLQWWHLITGPHL